MQSGWDPARINALIDQIRATTGLSQAALARLGGFDAARITRWKTGYNRPDYDSIAKLVSGIAAVYPDVADVAPELFAAAGYAGGAGADDRPEIVVVNWRDPQVRQLWRLQRIPPEAKLGLVTDYLTARARAESDEPPVPAPPPGALRRFIELAEGRRAALGFSRPQIAARAEMPGTSLKALVEDGSAADLRESDLPRLDHALYWRAGSSSRVLYEAGMPAPLPVRTVEDPEELVQLLRAADPSADPGTDAGCAGA
jgi:transcriptional regulator with XRE-family HTH domain